MRQPAFATPTLMVDTFASGLGCEITVLGWTDSFQAGQAGTLGGPFSESFMAAFRNDACLMRCVNKKRCLW